MKPWGSVTFIGVILLARAAVVVGGAQSAAEYCRQAHELLAKGNYQRAHEAAQRALQTDSHSAEAEDLIGIAEFGLGELAAAQKHLERALELQPGLIDARRTLGATFLKQKRPRDARREFLLVLASEPRDFLSVYSVGLTFLLDNQPAEALKHFERASQLKPHDSTLLANELRAHLRLKQEPQAATTLAELDTQWDAHDQRRVQVAALLVSEGAYKLAAREFEVLHKAQPESDEVSYNLALAYHRAGQEAQASALLESLLAGKEKADLEDLLGEVQQSRGDRTRSLAAFGRAVELEPRNEEYRYDYAQALARQGALHQAVEVFAIATKDFPRSVRMWLGWGATYYLAGKYTEAARTILEAVEIAPQRAEAYYLLGRAYDAAGPLQDAIAQRFAHYVNVRPKDAWARFFYARILIARSQAASSRGLVEAQRHLEAAIELDGNLAEAYTELGNVLEMRGQLDAARKELERAVQLDPNSTSAFYKLARVYRNLGELDRAQRATERFQQLKVQGRGDVDRGEIQGFLEHPKR